MGVGRALCHFLFTIQPWTYAQLLACEKKKRSLLRKFWSYKILRNVSLLWVWIYLGYELEKKNIFIQIAGIRCKVLSIINYLHEQCVMASAATDLVAQQLKSVGTTISNFPLR